MRALLRPLAPLAAFALACTGLGCEHHRDTGPAMMTSVNNQIIQSATANDAATQVFIALSTSAPGDSCLNHLAGSPTAGGGITLDVNPSTVAGKTFPLGSDFTSDQAELDLYSSTFAFVSISGTVTFSADSTPDELKGTVNAVVIDQSATSPGPVGVNVMGTFDAPSCAPYTF